jgi:hypothetical protein
MSSTKTTDIEKSTTTETSNNSNVTDSDDKTQITNLFYSVFNQSNILILLWFLAIYIIIYVILGILNKPSEEGNGLLSSRMFDIIVFGIIGCIIIYNMLYQSSQDKEKDISGLITSYTNYINDGNSYFQTIIIALFFYLGVYVTGIPMDNNKPLSIQFFESALWITFIVSLIVLFFNTILKVSIVDAFNRLISGTWNVLPEEPTDAKKEDNTKDTNKSKDKKEPEVFHISNNLYTYDDAQTICASYGARLATYDDIEKAYNEGAEWCGYGWSANQMALFPTQKSTWDKLQANDKHKNDCGRPGINGGYMANPNLRFGVNCFGIKPEPRQVEKDIMAMKQHQLVPRDQKDIDLDRKVQFWKENGDKLLRISSFNRDKWSEY